MEEHWNITKASQNFKQYPTLEGALLDSFSREKHGKKWTDLSWTGKMELEIGTGMILASPSLSVLSASIEAFIFFISARRSTGSTGDAMRMLVRPSSSSSNTWSFSILSGGRLNQKTRVAVKRLTKSPPTFRSIALSVNICSVFSLLPIEGKLADPT